MLKKYGSVAITLVACVLIFLSVYAFFGFYPFGEGLVAWCDMTQQTIPLINSFKDIISSGFGMFQNFSHAGGMDFYGVFFFFLASPFNLLTLFVDKLNIPQFMNILVMLKLSVAGAAAAYFFSKRYEELGVALKTLLGISYAFCGYGMLFYQNIIWLDIMILFPFILLGMYSLLEEGKMLTLIVTLNLCIVINYYISFMVILFIILFFGIKSVFKKCSSDTYIKLGISALIVLILSAVVWLPCLIQYFSSARGENVIDGLVKSAFLGHFETTVPIILCSALSISVILFSAISGNFKNNKDKLVIILTLIIPLVVEPVNMIWHTGNYMSFPARFAFITVFLMEELCAECLSQIPSVKKGNTLISILSVFLCAVCGGFILWYTKVNIKELSTYTSSLWGNFSSFEKILGIFTAALIVYCVILFVYRRQKISKTVFSLALSLLIVCECVSSMHIYMVPTKDSFDYENYEKIYTAVNTLDDESFCFVKQDKKYTDANQLGGFGLNTFGHYTSLNSASFMEAAKMLGYSGYWMEINSSGGSLLSDALLGIKYSLVKDEDDYSFTQNKVFRAALFSDSQFPEMLIGSRLTALDKALAGVTKTNLVTKYDSAEKVEGRFGGALYENELIHYTADVKEPTALYFDCYNGFSNNLVEPLNDSISVYVGNKTVISGFPNQSSNGLVYLGEFENTVVNITIKVSKDIFAKSFGIFGINVTEFNRVCATSEGINLKQSGGSLEGEITSSKEKNVFVGIPYKEGIRISIDGQQVEANKALTGFVSFNTNGLVGKLRISYVPKGFTAGVCITVIGVILFIALLVFKRIEFSKPLQKIAKLLFKMLFTVFVLAVYIAPVILCLLKP